MRGFCRGVSSGTFLALALALAASAAHAAAQTPGRAASAEPPGTATVLEIDGAIGPATSRYVVRGLEAARQAGSRVVVLQLDTPGGLDSAMRDIIRAILASPVPVASYVTPSGARAASAGTYILYASHVAAMAPATNLGAATPVSIGGEPEAPSPPIEPPGKPTDKGGGGAPGGSAPPSPAGSAMERKVVNDAVAYIRGLAELRGRNADWAEKAVREAATLSANGALQANVIDLIARSSTELLNAVDGRMVEVAGGETRHLATKNAVQEAIDPGWISRFLAVITDPNVAFILLMVGTYGLIFEFLSPGMVAPGVVGTICLLLGLYALNMLPINYAGLGLMLVGITLLAIEAFNPTVVLGLGGVIAFVLGAMMLFNVEAPGFRLSWFVIGITAALFTGLVLVVLGSLRRARKSPVCVGAQAMRGVSAEVLDWAENEGHVFAQGERWQASGAETFKPGEMVEVANIIDLTLVVRRHPAPVSKGGAP